MSDTLCVHTSSVGRTHIATCATCAVLCKRVVLLSSNINSTVEPHIVVYELVAVIERWLFNRGANVGHYITRWL